MQEIILKIGILKEDYQKAFKKLALVFLLNPFPLGKILKNKKWPGTIDQCHSSDYNIGSEKFLY